MKITVLMDNLETPQYKTEWGLSLWVENGERKILLDAGTTGDFSENAAALGVDVSQADYGVLSHAHFDHADGLGKFFEINKKAKVYLRDCCGEDCYIGKGEGAKYIGIHPGYLTDYADRYNYISGDYQIEEGVWLIPHKMSKEQAENCGKGANMYTCRCGNWAFDTFDHEQSLVIDTPKGLVIINGCCHGGAAQIIKEVSETFPDKHIYTLIGGFHLFRSNDDEIMDCIKKVDETGIDVLYTGHCTGERAVELFKEHMGERIIEIRSGLVIEI